MARRAADRCVPDVAVPADHTTGPAVRQVLARMPAEQRDVLVLRYYADLSEADIAEVLGIAPGTVKSLAPPAPCTRSRPTRA